MNEITGEITYLRNGKDQYYFSKYGFCDFSNGYLAYTTYKYDFWGNSYTKVGYMDMNGDMIIEPQFEEGGAFDEMYYHPSNLPLSSSMREK